jgi:anti-sigma B factor antagonist
VEGFQIEHRPEPGRQDVWRIDICGDLDLTAAPRLREVVEAACEQGVRSILLDLSSVTFLDSSGLRAIVEASTRIELIGGQIICTGLSGAAHRVLELTGVLESLRQGTEPEPA